MSYCWIRDLSMNKILVNEYKNPFAFVKCTLAKKATVNIYLWSR